MGYPPVVLARRFVRIESGSRIDMGDLVLRPPVVVAGVVTGPAARPVPGAEVVAVDRDGGLLGRAYSDDAGRFRLGVTRTEPAVVVASHTGFASAVAPLDRACADAPLRLGRSGTARVHLADSLTFGFAATTLDGFVIRTFPSSDRRVAGLPLGPVRFVARDADGSEVSRVATIVAGETVEVRLQ